MGNETVPSEVVQYGERGHIQPLGWLARQFVGPVGWPTQIVTVAAFLLTLWSFRLPFGPTGEILPAAGLWLLAGASWTIKPVIGSIMLRTHNYPRQRLKRGNSPLVKRLVAPALFAASIVMVRMDIPLEWALRISAPALEREATEALTDTQPWRRFGSWHPRMVGLFPVARCEVDNTDVDPPAVSFTLDRPGWGRPGLYYSRTPLTSRGHPFNGWGVPHHIYGPWYWWVYTGW